MKVVALDNNSQNIYTISQLEDCSSVIENNAIIKKHIAMRTCMVCRRCDAKTNLTRLVLNTCSDLVECNNFLDSHDLKINSGSLAGFIIDQTKTMAGRGYYVCNNENCWQKLSHFKNKVKQRNKNLKSSKLHDKKTN